jgi:hypothetical protein
VTRPAPMDLDPPRLAASPELRWLLLRAFGPADTRWSGPRPRDRRTAELAVRLDLATRIGSRLAADTVAREAGPTTAALVVEARDEAALRVACLRRLLDEVCEVAAGLGLRTMPLKGMACQLARSPAPGSRPMGDLDLLAPADGARRLFDRLLDRGCRQAAPKGTEYHLPVLVHPHGMVLEVHTRIGYLETPDGTPLDLGAALARGLTETRAGLPDGCLLPSEDLLTAHLLGHFFGQHRQSPLAYPLCRTLLDCADLAWSEARWGAFVAGGYPLIARIVPQTDVDAVRRLVGRLTDGEDAEAILDTDDRGSRILRHGVLGAVDPLYRGRLVTDAMVQSAGTGGRLTGLLAHAAGRVWRPRAELEARFGSGGGAAAHACRRLRGVLAPAWTAVRVGLPWLGSVVRDRLARRPRV